MRNEPKVSKAKLKLMQRAAQAQLKQAQKEAALKAAKEEHKAVEIEEVLTQAVLARSGTFDSEVIDADAGPSLSQDKVFSGVAGHRRGSSASVSVEPDTTTEGTVAELKLDGSSSPSEKSNPGLFKAVTSNTNPSTATTVSPKPSDSSTIQESDNSIFLHAKSKLLIAQSSPGSFKPIVSHAEAMLVSDPILPLASSPKSVDPDVTKELSPIPESLGISQTAGSVSSTTGPAEVVMVDEETRMSAETNSRAQTPAKQVVAPMDVVIEESQSSVQSTATTESGKASRPTKVSRLEVQEPEGAVISADQLTEYYWNGNGPFMLQEQVAQFLGIKSFKRKYPSIKRRMVDMQERDFIKENGLASEHMCDLGLTAVNSADILDIMYTDFQEKYEEYCKNQRDKQTKELINKQKALFLAASQDKTKDITEQAVRSAAQWNANFNKTRRDQRRACMDLQTLTVHYPKGKIKKIDKPAIGSYPVALVPGQFTDYYKEFTPTEINNLPLNTMCYNPINVIPPDDSDDSGSDGSSSDSDSSSSSSGSSSDSSSGVEDCKLCKHSPKKIAVSK